MTETTQDTSQDIQTAIDIVLGEITQITHARQRFGREVDGVEQSVEEMQRRFESLLRAESDTISGRMDDRVSDHLRFQEDAVRTATNHYQALVTALAERVTSLTSDLDQSRQDTARAIESLMKEYRAALQEERTRQEDDWRAREASLTEAEQHVRNTFAAYAASAWAIQNEIAQVTEAFETRLSNVMAESETEYHRRMTDSLDHINKLVQATEEQLHAAQTNHENRLHERETVAASSLAAMREGISQYVRSSQHFHREIEQKIKQTTENYEQRLSEVLSVSESEYHRRMTDLLDHLKAQIKAQETQIQTEMTRITDEAKESKQRMTELEGELTTCRQEIAELREMIQKKRGLFW